MHLCVPEPTEPVAMVGSQVVHVAHPFQLVLTVWRAMSGKPRWWVELDIAPIVGGQGRDVFVRIEGVEVQGPLPGAAVELV